MSELELVGNTVRAIRERFPEVRLCIEAPIMGRSVDLAMIKGNRTIAIEFKLKDWKRGLRQAADYKLASDLSYICLPTSRVSDEACTMAKELGVGILVVDLNCEWPFQTLVNASPSKEKWQRASESFRQYILHSQEINK